VILLDTHIWVWWVHDDPQLTMSQRQHLQDNEATRLGVSVISCWEVAKLVEVGWLTLPRLVGDWMRQALAYPGIHLFELTPAIAVESTQLPPPFHRDPADQMIVATARVHDVALLTADSKLLNYPHVRTLR
jgi:PIN domain nuclease of toxin-antitoxin system